MECINIWHSIADHDVELDQYLPYPLTHFAMTVTLLVQLGDWNVDNYGCSTHKAHVFFLNNKERNKSAYGNDSEP